MTQRAQEACKVGTGRGTREIDPSPRVAPLHTLSVDTAPLLSVTVAGHGPTLNDRMHFMARYQVNRAMKEAVVWAIRAQGYPLPPLERARVRATLLYSTRRYKDEDGAWQSIKGCVDGLVVGGVLKDDSPAHIEWLPLVQAKSEGGGRFTRLEVWSVEAKG